MDFNGIRPVNLVPKPLFESQEASCLQNRFVGTKIKLKKIKIYSSNSFLTFSTLWSKIHTFQGYVSIISQQECSENSEVWFLFSLFFFLTPITFNMFVFTFQKNMLQKNVLKMQNILNLSTNLQEFSAFFLVTVFIQQHQAKTSSISKRRFIK